MYLFIYTFIYLFIYLIIEYWLTSYESVNEVDLNIWYGLKVTAATNSGTDPQLKSVINEQFK